MEQKSFRTPHGTKITISGYPKEVDYVLNQCLNRNKIIMEIIKLKDTLDARPVFDRNKLFVIGEKDE